MAEHYYGWHPSLPDPRNIVADASLLPIKDEVDPRGDMTDPYDQGQLGSCTANAVAGAYQYDLSLDGVDFMPSRLMIYYEERLREGTVDYDSGAYGHDGFHALRSKGVVSEDEIPYDISRFTDAPTDQEWQDATAHKLTKYYKHPAPNITTLKRILSNNQTIAFGFTVFDSFESLEVERTGIVPLPKPTENILGGHEVLLVGYLADHPEYGLCRNSWGTGWGLGGYFLMPWAYILDSNLADDHRTIYRPWNG